MATEIEENRPGLAFLPGLVRLPDDGSYSMRGFRCRNNTLGAGKQYTRFEYFFVFQCLRLDQFVVQQLAHDGSSTVVAQSTRVNRCRDKIMSQSIHGQEWRHTHGIPKIIPELPPG